MNGGVKIPLELPEEKIPAPVPFPRPTPDAKTIADIMSKAADYCVIQLDDEPYRISSTEQPVIPTPSHLCTVEATWVWEERLTLTISADKVPASAFSPGNKEMRLIVPRDCINYALKEELMAHSGPVVPISRAQAVIVVRYATALEPSTLVVPRAILR